LSDPDVMQMANAMKSITAASGAPRRLLLDRERLSLDWLRTRWHFTSIDL
jgi:hypothetical protein